VFVARRLLVLVWHLLTKNDIYRYLQPQTLVTKLQNWAFRIGRAQLPMATAQEFVQHQELLRLTLLVALVLVTLLVGSAATSLVFGGEGGGQGSGGVEGRARLVIEIEGVVCTDAAEERGLLVVGVANTGLARAVEERLKQLGVPLSSVEIVETKPVAFVRTLRGHVRPLIGASRSLLWTVGSPTYAR
jgi:hypothetical protein